jgi:hypothetical protein
MEWCAAFNAECERLSTHNVVGVASRSDAQGGSPSVTLIDRDGNETTEDLKLNHSLTIVRQTGERAITDRGTDVSGQHRPVRRLGARATG